MSERAQPLRPAAPGEPFGLVAGGGRLPHIVAEHLVQAGWRPVVALIADARGSAGWEALEARGLGWGRTGDIFPYFRRHGVRDVAFCGTVSARPDYRSILPSLATLGMLPEILSIVHGGDDRLLRAVSSAFERRGYRLHAVHEIVPDLLMPTGPISRNAPSSEEERALRLAETAAWRLGELDVGQAAVASAERVIALEGIEGTRDMLRRVAELRARGRIGRTERAVLFKSVKPSQDERFDLPSIGIATVEEAAEAGLAGIGMTAGASLLLDAGDVIAAADRHGLFLTGRSRILQAAGSDAP